jgi:Sulfatase
MTSERRWRRWQYLLIGMSLANLSFLKRWREMLTYLARDEYFMLLPPSPAQYYAGITNVLVFGFLIALCAYLISWVKPGVFYKVSRVAFLVLLLFPLNALREMLADQLPYLRGPLIRLIGERATLVLVVALLALFIFMFTRWPSHIYAGAMTGLLILSPFVLMTVGRAVWSAATYNPQPFLDHPPHPPVQPGKATDIRAVWLIFDEMDQRLTFDERCSDLQLPELDRFRQTSVHASQALPPSGATLTSLPSLITGRLVKAARPTGPSDLLISYVGSSAPVSWAGQPNVFTRAHALGLNTALGGWYHPYCRILASDVTQCNWSPMELMINTVGRKFQTALLDQMRGVFETSLYSPFGQSLVTKARVRREATLVAWAQTVIADPSISLAFVHLQPPHTPYAYNRRSGLFDLQNSAVQGYIDSLALVDKTFGELRRTMEQANVWDHTAVLISSDHWYRSAPQLDGKLDHRVPFLLKLPGQTTAATFDQPFNTVLSQELLLCILKKDIRTAQDVVRWLELRRNDEKIRPR